MYALALRLSPMPTCCIILASPNTYANIKRHVNASVLCVYKIIKCKDVLFFCSCLRAYCIITSPTRRREDRLPFAC